MLGPFLGNFPQIEIDLVLFASVQSSKGKSSIDAESEDRYNKNLLLFFLIVECTYSFHFQRVQYFYESVDVSFASTTDLRRKPFWVKHDH